MSKQYQCFFCSQPIHIDGYGEGRCSNHGGTKIRHSTSYLLDEHDTGFDFVSFDINDYEVIYDIKSLRGGVELDVWGEDNSTEIKQGIILISLKDFGDQKPITPENAEEKIKTYLLFS